MTLQRHNAKSKLTDILEKMSSAKTPDVIPHDIQQPNKHVTVIDAMADVQSMVKNSLIKMCKDLSSFHFYKENMINDELHIVFDRYDIPNSLNSAARHVRLDDSYPIT